MLILWYIYSVFLVRRLAMRKAIVLFIILSALSVCYGDIITVDDDGPADLAIMAMHWQQEE